MAAQRDAAAAGSSVPPQVSSGRFSATDLSRLPIPHISLPIKIPECIDFVAVAFDPPRTRAARAKALDRYIADLSSKDDGKRIEAARRLACWSPEPTVDGEVLRALHAESRLPVAAELSLCVAIRDPDPVEVVLQTTASILEGDTPRDPWELATISVAVFASAVAVARRGGESDRKAVLGYVARLRLVPGQAPCADEIASALEGR